VTTPRARLHSISVLAAICVLALGLRILGLAYGLPAVYNPDETPILNRALAFAKGDPNPHNFVYPSLYFYVLFAWEGLFYVAGRVAGLFDSLGAFQRDFFIDPSRHFLAARALTAVCGIAAVAALYSFGRRLYDRPTGLAAAAFLAVAPIAVRDAHYVKLDVPVTLAVVLAHVAFARIVTDPAAAARRRSWVLSGLLAGLAVSTQYYVVFIAFSMLGVAVADVRRSGYWRESGRLFLWATAAAVAGFFAGTPFLLADLQKAISDVAHVREVDIDRAAAGGPFSALGAYVVMLFRDAVGWPVAAAAAAGAIWSLAVDWRRGLLLVAFSIPFLAFIANTVPMSRYLNAMLPFVALAAAFAIVRAARAFGPYAGPATVALVVLALIPGLLASVQTDLFIRQADTRTLAHDFVLEHIPAGSSFLVQPYSVPLRQSREALIEAVRSNVGSESRASIKSQLMLALEPYPAPAYRLIYFGDGGLDRDKIYILPASLPPGDGLAPLRQLGIDYVVLKRSHGANPELQPLEEALSHGARRLAEFSPYRNHVPAAERAVIPPFLHNTSALIDPALERPGPTVEIWSIVPSTDEPGRGVREGGTLQ
jgi:hypothetical protein